MGHRANFVVIQDHSAKAYYHQWAALGSLETFSDGPETAIAALSECELTTELMDWAFAEGGYLIDIDHRHAIVFGVPFDEDEFGDEGDFDEDFGNSEDETDEAAIDPYDPKHYLSRIAPAWTGWKLVYDERGVDAFSDYLQKAGITGITFQKPSHPDSTTPPCELQA